MALMTAEDHGSSDNPLDIMEDIVRTNEWLFDRSSEHELLVEMSGRWCDYSMFFVWRDEVKAL